ncbi:MAG: ATP-binding protein [Oscillatoriales cyanobacterium]|nr:MAG: ATP-binding protein [Oscillatoriales cyanobacterium]
MAALTERGYRRSKGDLATRQILCALPARDSARFEGRDRVWEQLNNWLTGPGGDRLLVIEGAGGTGKTALALETVQRLVRRGDCPFGAVIFVSAQATQLTGMGILPKLQSTPTLDGLLVTIAEQLQRPIPDRCQDERSRWQWVWQQLTRQHTLLMVDGFEALSDPAAIAAVLCDLPATVRVLITSRQRLPFERSIRLSGLESSAALAWISARAEDAGWPWLPSDYQTLVEITGGLPGAIAWVLGQVATGQSLPWAIAQLQRPDCVVARFYCHSALATLQAQWAAAPLEPPAAAPALSPQGGALTSLEHWPTSERVESQIQALATPLLAILSWFARPVSQATLAVIADQEPDAPALSAALSKIARESIVELNGVGHYGLTPFMRQYVATQLVSEWPVAAALAARERWVQWAIDYARQHGHEDRLEWPTDTTALDAQWATLQDVLDWCLAQGWLDRFWDVFRPLRGYTHFRGYWRDRIARNTAGLAIARAQGDRTLEAQFLFDRGWTRSLNHDTPQLARAMDDYRAAWELREFLNLDWQIDLLINQFRLATLLLDRDSPQQWHEQIADWVNSPRLDSDRATRLQCQWLYYQADALARQGRERSRALQYYRQALELAQCIHWNRAVIYIQSSIGTLQMEQSLYHACRDLQASHDMAENVLDLRCLAYCKQHLAQAKKRLGKLTEAKQMTQGAIALFEFLQMESEVAQLQQLMVTLP